MGVKMEDLKGVKMEVKKEVKYGVKMDNTCSGATAAAFHLSPLTPTFNSRFNSTFNSQKQFNSHERSELTPTFNSQFYSQLEIKIENKHNV